MQFDWIAPPGGGLGVSLDGLAKDFGERSVLQRVDLQIAPGDFVAIVGRSGCGKSTLLRLLAGLETPSRGAVLLGGAPLADHRADIRIMFQEARLLPWRTVLQNVQLGLSDQDGRERARRRWPRSDWPIAPTSGPRCSRAASASASRSRERWCTGRACCCWTSRWAHWTR